MRFLIVGGDGIIGTRMVSLLGEWGHEPWVLGQRKREFPTYIRADILYPTDIQMAVQRSRPDIIVHLAAEVSRRGVELTPIKTAMINSIGTLNLVTVANSEDIPLIYASTSEVYGRHCAEETIMETTPVDPYHNMYALTKYQGEQFITYFAQAYGLKASIARIFLTYGGAYPGYNTGMSLGTAGAITLLLHGLMSGKRVVAHTDTIRQWCYVNDTVAGLVAMTKAKSMLYGGSPDIYHIGRDEPYSMVDATRLIADVIGQDPSLIDERPCPSDVIPVKRASFYKIKTQLGWEAETPLREGIKRYADWLRPRLVAEV